MNDIKVILQKTKAVPEVVGLSFEKTKIFGFVTDEWSARNNYSRHKFIGMTPDGDIVFKVNNEPTYAVIRAEKVVSIEFVVEEKKEPEKKTTTRKKPVVKKKKANAKTG